MVDVDFNCHRLVCGAASARQTGDVQRETAEQDGHQCASYNRNTRFVWPAKRAVVGYYDVCNEGGGSRFVVVALRPIIVCAVVCIDQQQVCATSRAQMKAQCTIGRRSIGARQCQVANGSAATRSKVAMAIRGN